MITSAESNKYLKMHLTHPCTNIIIKIKALFYYYYYFIYIPKFEVDADELFMSRLGLKSGPCLHREIYENGLKLVLIYVITHLPFFLFSIFRRQKAELWIITPVSKTVLIHIFFY